MRNAFKKLSDDRQIKILDAAASIFAEKGFYQANIADICRKAGISNGALYNYFRNKEALYTAVFTRTSDLISAAYQYWSTQDGDFFSILENGLKEVVPFSREHRDYMVVYFEHGHPAMDRFASALSDQIEKMSLDFWALLLEKGKKDGAINPAIDVNAAAYMLDNHTLMLAFSCISEHHSQRFHRYFGRPNASYTDEEKVGLMIRSFRQFLT